MFFLLIGNDGLEWLLIFINNCIQNRWIRFLAVSYLLSMNLLNEEQSAFSNTSSRFYWRLRLLEQLVSFGCRRDSTNSNLVPSAIFKALRIIAITSGFTRSFVWVLWKDWMAGRSSGVSVLRLRISYVLAISSPSSPQSAVESISSIFLSSKVDTTRWYEY